MDMPATATLTTPLGPRDAGIPMTLDEFDDADFVPGHRYELIHGVLVVTPSPLEEERDSNEELGHWLRSYRDSHPQGGALDLTLPEHNLRTRVSNRRADRAIWTGLGRLPRTRGQVAERETPTIVVEFPSSRAADQRRDYLEKRDEYRDLGVQEYWIIDRFRRLMTVYSWQDDEWTPREIKPGKTYATPHLPGFELSPGRLLGISDRYADQPGEYDE